MLRCVVSKVVEAIQELKTYSCFFWCPPAIPEQPKACYLPDFRIYLSSYALLMRFLFFSVLFILVASLSAQACTAAGDGSFTVNPPLPPAGATYPAGTVVEMCYTLDEYSNPFDNWLHSLVVEFGPGFNANSVVPSSIPASCNGNGSWNWYNSWTSCYSGLNFGPGFAYDGTAGLGCGGTPNDGNPGNNYGDGPTDCTHVWCWSVNTIPAPNNCNVNLYTTRIRVFGDSETGSWTAGGNPPPCLNTDPICWPEIGNVDAMLLNAPCAPELFQVEATFDGGSATCGFAIEWQDAAGNVVATGQNASLDEGTYRVVISLPGCSQYTDQIVLAYDTDIPTLEVSPSDVPFCSGDEFTLIAGGGDFYLFYPPDGSGPLEGDFNGNTLTRIANASANGTWRVFIGQDNSSCSTELTVDITAATGLSALATTNGPICLGQTITFTGSGAPVNGTYEWLVNGASSFNNPFVFTPNSTGMQTATLTVYEPGGCSAETTVNFQVFPTINASINPSNSVICEGESITLTATGGSTYAWSNGQSGPSISVSPASSTTYIVTATGPGNCQDDASVTIDVQPLLDAPTVSCEVPAAGEVVFSWNAVAGATSYIVNVLTGQSGTLNGTTYTLTGLALGELVQITVAAQGGIACQTATSAIQECQALSCPDVVVSVLTPPDTFCFDNQNDPLALALAVNGAVNPTDTTWSGPGVVGNTFDADLAGPGNHPITVTVTDDNCPFTASVILTVLDLPTASFSLDSDVCTDSLTIVNYTGTADPANSTFAWDFGGGIATPGTGPGPHSISWPNAGTATVSLVVTEGNCTAVPNSQEINVIAPLPAPAVTCGGGDIDSVSFAWPPIPGASGYVVQIDGGAPQTITNTSIGLGGLVEGQMVTISVYAQGTAPCGDGPTADFVCIAAVCPEITLTIDESSNNFCLEDPAAFHLLQIAFNSGDGSGTYTWSGANVSNDTFFYGQAGLGNHQVFLLYTEGSCTYADTATFTVFEVPTANFALDASTLCITDQATATYTGSATATAQYDWDFGTATATPGTGPGPHQLSWDSPGEQTISLRVTENGCPSPIFSQTISLIDTLALLALSCGSSSLQTASISWLPITAATAYEITIDGSIQDTTTATTFTATALAPGQVVNFTVRPLGAAPCGDGSPVSITCQSLDCPVLLADFSANTNTFCLDPTSDQSIILSATISGGSGNDASFNWSGLGVIGNIFDPAQAGIGAHTIVLNYQEFGPCSLVDSFLINVFPLPNTDFTISANSICLGDSIVLALAGAVPPNSSQVSWNLGGVLLDGQGPHTFAPNAAGIVDITVTVSINGCTQTSSPQTLEIVAPLTAPILSCDSNTLESTTFAWEAVSGALGYIVLLEDGSRDTVNSLAYTLAGLSPSQVASIEVIAIGNAPCGDSSPTSLSCSAMDCPNIQLSATASQQIFCFGLDTDAVGINLSSSGGDMSGSFTINHPAVSFANGSYFFDPTAAGIGPHIIVVDYVETAGCSAQTTITMEVLPVPIADFSISSALVCEEEITTIAYTGTATASWNFAGAAVTSLSNETYQIRFAQAGSYPIQLIVNAGNCSDTLLQTIEVIAPLALPEPFCTATTLTSITFAWPSVVGSNGYRIQIDDGPALTLTDTFYVVENLTDEQNVIISVTAIGSAPCGDSEAASTSCSSLPCTVYELQATASQQAFCTATADTPIPLELLFLNTPQGSGSIQWFGEGVESQNGQFVFNPQGLAAGTYVLTAAYTESICTTQATLEMLVTNTPNISLQLSETSICEGSTTLLTLSGDVDTSLNFTFDFDEASVQNLGNNQYLLDWATPGNYTISLLADRNGCEQIATNTIAVAAQPTAGTVSGPLTICAGSGEVLALSEQLLGADNGGSWSPSPGSPATIDAGSGQLLTQNMAPGTYTYVYTIAGGVCETVASELTVTLLPAPRVDAGLNQTLTCAMGMVSLSGNGQSDGGGQVSYRWTGPEGSFLTDSSSAMIDVSAPGFYTLRVTDEIGCSATDEVLVNAETEVPIPQIELSNISCFSANDGVILITSVDGGRPPYRYALDNAPPGNTTFFTGLQAGEYNLRVSDANGCFSDLFLDISQPEQLRVSLSVNSNRTEYEVGEEVTVTAQITGGNVIDTLLWEPDSLGFRGEGNSLTFLASETQQIRVTVIDEQGCRSSDQTIILVRKDVPVYIPNGFSPNGDNINDILFVGANDDRIRRVESFLIFNRWGEAVFQNYNFAPNDSGQGWDGSYRGEALDPAVFVYVAVVEMADGEKIVFKGDITLVR